MPSSCLSATDLRIWGNASSLPGSIRITADNPSVQCRSCFQSRNTSQRRWPSACAAGPRQTALNAPSTMRNAFLWVRRILMRRAAGCVSNRLATEAMYGVPYHFLAVHFPLVLVLLALLCDLRGSYDQGYRLTLGAA